MQLKILSWNIWFHGNLEKVNEFLEKSNADILGLQEVMMVDEKIRLSNSFINESGYKYVYAPAFEYPINGVPTNIGNAVFSKYAITFQKIHNLSEEENRVAVQADVQVGDKILHIFNTHLFHTHQQPSELQDTQATNLVKVLTTENTILLGDFNALSQSNAIKIINSVLKNTDVNSLPTWSVYPEGCKTCLPKGIIYKLDSIFTSQDLKSSSFNVEHSK
ncbi:endonuclease/exonuclease/phosphatase family protein, partial [Candidatus Roizmanbacteria bacterium]|nr:endonuclease/exonuclease/phosphatase family protein [Candidatus Roizmanbacteria bacterium]